MDMVNIEGEVNVPEKADEDYIVMDLVNLGPQLYLSGCILNKIWQRRRRSARRACRRYNFPLRK